MIKKGLIAIVFSMICLSSTSVMAFRETGIYNHTNGKDCSEFYQGDSYATYSGGWTETSSTNKTGNHWTKRTVRNGNEYFYSYIKVINGGEWNGPQSLTSSYVKSKVNVRSKMQHIHKLYVES